MEELLITSGFNFEGYSITKYLGYCSGECALGTGFLSSFGAGIADFLGSNSTMYEEKLNRAKNQALDKIKHNAISMGANAIIGIAVNYTAFSADIMGVTVNGTAVKIEKKGAKNLPKAEFPISEYNPHFPIRPLKLYINEEELQYSLVLYAKNFSGHNNIALKADVVFTNVFNDQYTLSNVIFSNFTNNPKTFEFSSSKTLVTIPSENLIAIKSIDVFLTKFVCDSESIEPTDTEYSPKDEKDLIKEYLLSIRAATSVNEILFFTERFSAQNSFQIPNGIQDIINDYTNAERLYGNMGASCLKDLEKYCSSLM